MSEIKKVINKIDNRKSLLEELIRNEIDRELTIASSFPGYGIVDKQVITREQEEKFFNEIMQEIEDAHIKELLKNYEGY